MVRDVAKRPVRVVIPTVFRPECPTIRSRLLPLCKELVREGFNFEFLVLGEGVETVVPGVTFRGYRNYFELAWRILNCGRENTDILFPCKAYSITGLLSFLVARCKGIGYLLDVDDRTFPSEINKWWRLPLYLQEWLSERLLMLLRPLTLVASRALVDHWGKHAIYLPNSADLVKFDRSKWNSNIIFERHGLTGPVLIWPAVFFQETDRRYVLDIFSELQLKGTHVSLLVIGDGDYLPLLKDRARKLGLAGVSFAGAVPYSQMPHYYAAATAGLLPLRNNHYDACKGPIKLYEYMAMSLPVIATDVGEPRETVTRAQCGILLPFDDAGQAAQMVVDFLKDKNKLEKFGKHGRRYLQENQSFDTLADRLLQLLDAAAARNSCRLVRS